MRRVSAPTVLIMAAGQGTRMKSAVPKVLHPVCGRALVAWPIEAAREAGAGRIGVIVSPDRDISGALPEGVETIPQPEANGTGGALLAAAQAVADSETVIVLSGDVPLVSAELIAEIVATHGREAPRRPSSPPSSTIQAPTGASSAPPTVRRSRRSSRRKPTATPPRPSSR